MMAYPVTYTIFRSNKITFSEKGESGSILANCDISVGEIILIEHCFFEKDSGGSKDITKSMLKCYPDLLNELYPRNKGKILTDKDIQIKIMRNSFSDNKNGLILGRDTSKFTLSTAPNAILRNVSIKFNSPVYAVFSYIFAHKNIKKGDNIFIWYGIDNSCDKINISKPIIDIISEYIKTENFSDVMVAHICIFYGLFISESIIITEKFVNYFVKEYRRTPKNDDILKWLEIKIEPFLSFQSFDTIQ